MSINYDKVKAFIDALNLTVCEICHLVSGNSVCENNRSLTLYRCDVAALGFCIWKMVESYNNNLFQDHAEKFLDYIDDSSTDLEEELSKVLNANKGAGRLKNFCANIFDYGKFKVTRLNINESKLENAIEILGERCANYANALYLTINTIVLHEKLKIGPEKRCQTYNKLLMCACGHNGLGKFKDKDLERLLKNSKKNIVEIERRIFNHLEEREEIVEARLFDICGRSFHMAQTCATLSQNRFSDEKIFVSRYKPGIVMWTLLGAENNMSNLSNSLGDMFENFYVLLERGS